MGDALILTGFSWSFFFKKVFSSCDELQIYGRSYYGLQMLWIQILVKNCYLKISIVGFVILDKKQYFTYPKTKVYAIC